MYYRRFEDTKIKMMGFRRETDQYAGIAFALWSTVGQNDLYT